MESVQTQRFPTSQIIIINIELNCCRDESQKQTIVHIWLERNSNLWPNGLEKQQLWNVSNNNQHSTFDNLCKYHIIVYFFAKDIFKKNSRQNFLQRWHFIQAVTIFRGYNRKFMGIISYKFPEVIIIYKTNFFFIWEVYIQCKFLGLYLFR